MITFNNVNNVIRMLKNYEHRMGKIFVSIIVYVENKNTKEIKKKLILTSEKVKDLSSKLLKSLELHLKDKEKVEFSEEEKILLLKAFTSEQDHLSELSKKREIFELEMWNVFDAISKEQTENAEDYLKVVNNLL